MANITLLGHTFAPFDDNDWETFAGAEEGSYICYVGDDKTVLIWNPATKLLSEMDYSDESWICSQRDWTFEQISE